MQKIGIAIGIVGLLAISWFLYQGSSIDHVATVDDELSKLELELSMLDGVAMEEAAATAAQNRIASRLGTINASLAASQDRTLTQSQTQTLDAGLDRLQEILVDHQDTLVSIDQAVDQTEITSSSATIAELTQTIGAIQTYLGIPESIVVDGSATTTDTIDGINAAATTTPSTDEDNLTLQTKPWTWEQTTYNDGTVYTPSQPEDFVMTFTDDSAVSITTDCNSISGTYTLDGTQITFEQLAMTKMFCPDSQEQVFADMLEQVQSYFFTAEGQLVFDLKFDSGSSVFR